MSGLGAVGAYPVGRLVPKPGDHAVVAWVKQGDGSVYGLNKQVYEHLFVILCVFDQINYGCIVSKYALSRRQ